MDTPTDTPLAQRLALAGEGSTRLDGWTPARMAAFVDALASTGCVEAACQHLGMAKSGLYEARRRNPLFALAWEDALIDSALPKLADELLTHAFKGSVERYYRDGEMVGEKHFTNTHLGLALLKRLDRLAADRKAADTAARLREEAADNAARLREEAAEKAANEKERLAAARDPLEPEQVDELDDKPFSPTLDQPHPRIIHTGKGWQTSFPPPEERDPEDEVRTLGADATACRYDPLEVPDLEAEDRWPGSPGYLRYCTLAENRALDRWVDRQLAPVHADHARFFDVLGAHGGNDDPALLLGLGDGPLTTGER
jgi:hypothetical protein